MLNPEVLFQHIFKEEWKSILDILYHHKKEIKGDTMLLYAGQVFEEAFINKVKEYPKDDENTKTLLTTFWQLHHGGFYEVSNANYQKLLVELVERLPDWEAANFARLINKENKYERAIELSKNEVIESVFTTETFGTPENYKKLRERMPDFETEIRESFGKEYVKVFLRDKKRLAEIQIVLNELPSIKTANITANKEVDLTVYPNRLYSSREVQEDINNTLNVIFLSKEVDPILKDDVLVGLSQDVYRKILDLIYHFGKNLEKYASLRVRFDEEGYREYFLPYLNLMSNSHTATGETFNKIGKTDILIHNQKGENVFIAECKVWGGEGEIAPAIDQLLDRYVNWRDEKVALVIFNKTVKGFSDIIEKAISAVKSHKLFREYNGKTQDSSASFIFQHPEDIQKNIEVELIMFDCT